MRRLYPPKEARLLPPEAVSPYPDLVFPPSPAERPYTYINMAATLDGKIVTGNPKAGFLLSGSEGDRRGMGELRARADAVMIGAGTLRAENPSLAIRYSDLREARAAAGRAENPRPIIVSNSGNVDPDARVFGDPRAMVLTSRFGFERLPPGLKSRVEVLAAGEETVDLTEAARKLRTAFGVSYLLVEGGGKLTYSFLAEHLADEFFLTLAPLAKAGPETPSLVEGPAFPYGSLPRFRLLALAQDGDELYLRYGTAR